jgi:hypothetical protein
VHFVGATFDEAALASQVMPAQAAPRSVQRCWASKKLLGKEAKHGEKHGENMGKLLYKWRFYRFMTVCQNVFPWFGG